MTLIEQSSTMLWAGTILRDTAPCTLHSAHFSWHSAHCTQQTAHCIVHTIHTKHYTLYTANCTLNTTHWILHTVPYTLHTAYNRHQVCKMSKYSCLQLIQEFQIFGMFINFITWQFVESWIPILQLWICSIVCLWSLCNFLGYSPGLLILEVVFWW